MTNNQNNKQIQQDNEDMLEQQSFLNPFKEQENLNSQQQDSVIEENPEIKNKFYYKSPPKIPQSPQYMESDNYQLKQVQAESYKMNQQFQIKYLLPNIIKGKELYDRKETIEIFKSKIYNDLDQCRIRKKTVKNKSGKIYVNEIWSEKYLKLIVLESKIQQNVEKIQKLDRRIVQEYIDDIPLKKIIPSELPFKRNILKKTSMKFSQPIPLVIKKISQPTPKSKRMKTLIEDKNTTQNSFRDSIKLKKQNLSHNSSFVTKFNNLINDCKNYDLDYNSDMKTTTQISKYNRTSHGFLKNFKSQYSQFLLSGPKQL